LSCVYSRGGKQALIDYMQVQYIISGRINITKEKMQELIRQQEERESPKKNTNNSKEMI